MKETVINAFADKAVLERLFTNGPGELLAVNSKAGYLKAGQDVYMLCSADLGITPIGIAVDDYAAAAAALRLSASPATPFAMPGYGLTAPHLPPVPPGSASPLSSSR